MNIKKAERQGVKPLVGLVGISGGGKTKTGLLLARGFVGPQGKICVVDTENKRASLFADEIPGGYDTLNLEPPFSPQRYQEAHDAVLAGGYSAVLYDSATHEWLGYLDLKEQEVERMAGNDYKKREKCGFAATARMKPHHVRFVNALLRSNIMVILCFRGKEKVRMGKDANGKTTIEKDDFISPIQDSGLIFECLIAGEVYAKEQVVGGRKAMVGGFFHCTKHTVAALLQCLPDENEQLGIKHGELLARWCSTPSTSGSPSTQTTTTSAPDIKALKKQLWDMTRDIHLSKAPKLTQWLIDEMLLTPEETLETLTAERLRDVVAKVPSKLPQGVSP